MNPAQKLISIGRTLVRGYKVETPVRGSRSAARLWLNEALRGVRRLDTLQVQYEIGLENWLDGKTLLVVRGDGSVEVRNLSRGEVKAMSGTIVPNAFHALIHTMNVQQFYTIDPVKECSFPDQSEIRVILIETTQPDKFWVRVWESKIDEYPGFAAVVSMLRGILKEVTVGAII